MRFTVALVGHAQGDNNNTGKIEKERQLNCYETERTIDLELKAVNDSGSCLPLGIGVAREATTEVAWRRSTLLWQNCLWSSYRCTMSLILTCPLSSSSMDQLRQLIPAQAAPEIKHTSSARPALEAIPASSRLPLHPFTAQFITFPARNKEMRFIVAWLSVF